VHIIPSHLAFPPISICIPLLPHSCYMPRYSVYCGLPLHLPT
jgi:hypothetical protein